MRDGDVVLIIWILVSALWDCAVIGMTTYLVFWRGHSGWWFLLALMMTCSETLFQALRKRFGLSLEKEES